MQSMDKVCAKTSLDARERHKKAERERRKSMHELFLSLHSLLPNAHAVRKEQSTILQEIINFIPLAVSHLHSLQTRGVPAHHATTTVQPASNGSNASSADFHIRVSPNASSTVSIRVRGDHVNVSFTDRLPVLLSMFLDELEACGLKLVRSSHWREGCKLVYHFENEICKGMKQSPSLVKTGMQELASKLLKLRKSSTKRSFDQL